MGYNRAIRSLQRALGDWKERAIDKNIKHYAVETYDLGTARTNEEQIIEGDFIQVESCSGSLVLRLNELSAPEIDLTKQHIIYSPFGKFYLTNSAQSGESAVLVIGGDASFESEALLFGRVGLVDKTSTQIDPATEDKQDDTITALGLLARTLGDNDRTVVAIAASGTNTVIYPVGGQAHKIIRLVFVCDGTNTIKLVDGTTTSISGSMTFSDRGGLAADADFYPIILTSDRTFSISTENSNGVNGWCQYKTA